MSLPVSDAQIVRLVGLVIEGASENGEARAEQYHARETDQERKYELVVASTRARLGTAREALLIVLGVNPTEEPF